MTIVSQLPQMHKAFFLSSYGIDIEKLVFNVEDWKKRKLPFPHIEEQQAIGVFFSNLDNFISSYQEKITQLEILKKKLLQDMFV